MFDKENIRIFKDYYTDKKTTLRDIEEIRSLFDNEEAKEYTIDEQTWNDLEMNKIFYDIDRNYSNLGEGVLYKILRNPLSSKKEIEDREVSINKIMDNSDLRANIQYTFYKLGLDKKNSFWDLMKDGIKADKTKSILYKFLGLLPLLLILFAFIGNQPTSLMIAFGVILVNMFINDKEKRNVSVHGLIYLNEILKATKKILSLELNGAIDNEDRLRELVKELEPISRNVKVVNITTMYGGFLEILAIPFLLLESAYYGVIDKIDEKKDAVIELYSELGKIEAYISIGIYKEINEENICKPKFIDEIKLEIKDGIHPLLKEPVANSINLNKKGVVLTGTNMAGKSTFLRMLGTNILFAQTFGYVLASKYEAPFFNIVSSISPNDDIDAGKSYYLAEAEAILRIIESLDKKLPVFCVIDEIFRGTNPVERIAASASILNYINSSNALTFVATHDRELTDMLSDNYDFYYFSEKVSNKEGLSFDYKIKSGLAKTRNAIKLLDYIGYPKTITENAKDFAKKIDKFN